MILTPKNCVTEKILNIVRVCIIYIHILYIYIAYTMHLLVGKQLWVRARACVCVCHLWVYTHTYALYANSTAF